MTQTPKKSNSFRKEVLYNLGGYKYQRAGVQRGREAARVRCLIRRRNQVYSIPSLSPRAACTTSKHESCKTKHVRFRFVHTRAASFFYSRCTIILIQLLFWTGVAVLKYGYCNRACKRVRLIVHVSGLPSPFTTLPLPPSFLRRPSFCSEPTPSIGSVCQRVFAFHVPCTREENKF